MRRSLDWGGPIWGRSMSPRYRALLLVLALIPGRAGAQPDMPLLDPGEISGLEVRRVSSFAGDALYGYINGGADLYHEYGFERLAVQELGLEGETYFTEVYRMTDPGGAFGIFSVSHRKCAPADSLPPSSCVAPSVIQWAHSRYFVRIAGESGSPVAQAGGLRLARRLVGEDQGGFLEHPSPAGQRRGRRSGRLSLSGVCWGCRTGSISGVGLWRDWRTSRRPSSPARIPPEKSLWGNSALPPMRTSNDSPARSPAGSGPSARFRRVIAGSVVLESDVPADSLWSRLVRLP